MPDMFSGEEFDNETAEAWNDIQEKYAVEDEPQVEAQTPAGGEAREETPAPAAAADDSSRGVEAKPAGENKPGTVGDRPRGEDGKFVKAAKAQSAKPARAPVPGTPEPVAPTLQGDQSQGIAYDVNRAPASWKPLARAEFDSLSPTLKAEIHRREQDFQRGQQQLLPDAQMGRDIRQSIEPFRMLLETAGAPIPRVISDVLRDVAILRTGTEAQKYQTVARIAQFHGIDLRRFAAAPQAQGAQPPQSMPQNHVFHDPRLDQFLAHQQRTQQQQLDAAVETFINDTGADGQPKHPYLQDVLSEVTALIPVLKQQNPNLSHAQALEAAYERATWAHPEVRTLLEQKRATDLEAQRRAENLRQVGAARKAGSVSVPRRASTPSPGKPASMEETIREDARALGFF